MVKPNAHKGSPPKAEVGATLCDCPHQAKVTLTCHHEAKPKDLANKKDILRFAQNDSFAVTLGTLHFLSSIYHNYKSLKQLPKPKDSRDIAAVALLTYKKILDD